MRINAIQWRSDRALIEKNKKEAVRFDLILGSTMTSITVAGDHRVTLGESLVAPAGELVFFEDMWGDRKKEAHLKIESFGDRVDISVVSEAYTYTVHFTAEETADLVSFLAEELPERFRD